MQEYRDFTYVSYILNSDFETGYGLLFKFKMLMKEKAEEKIKNQYWDLYLIDIQHGHKGSFEEYYKENIRQSKQNIMTHNQKKEEEEKIINKVKNIDFSKMKEKEIII